MSRLPTIGFLVLLAVAYFADGLRARLESKDPGTLPAVESGLPRLSKRVVFVLLDSLPTRVGTNQQIMPNLVALAQGGASGVLLAPPDTTTTAGVRGLSVGTKPSFRDTLEIFAHQPYPRWTVFDGIVGRGETVAFFGDHVWSDLLGDRAKGPGAATGPVAGSENLFADDQASLAAARARLKADEHLAFLSLHVSRTDFLAHQFGTEREEYRQKLREVDAELQGFIQEALTPGTTLIVTSDHGCDLYGNHGGSGEIYRRVPVLFLGAGIHPVQGFEMDGKQMPLVLATLLGARLPGGILESAPSEFLALSPSQKSELARADRQRIEALARFHGVQPDSPAATQVESLLTAIRNSSQAEPGTLLWIGVLYLGMALIALMIVTEIRVSGIFLGAACVLLAWLAMTSRFRIEALFALLAIEGAQLAFLISRLKALSHRLGVALALLGTSALVGVSAIRFSLGGAFLFAFAKPLAVLGALLLGASVGIHWLLRDRWPGRVSWTNTQLLLIPVGMFAWSLLQPIDLVPMLLCCVVILALRANGAAWRFIALTIAPLFLFLVLTQRIGFNWTGERASTRYLYTGIAGALVTAGVAYWTPRGRPWIVAALACVFSLWPFGFIKFGHAPLGQLAQIALLLGTSFAIFAFSWHTRSWRTCVVALGASVVYHLNPGPVTFGVALAAHFASLLLVGLTPEAARPKSFRIAALLLCLLHLMSSQTDLISVLLFSAILLAMGEILSEKLEDAALVLLGALLLASVRYGILNSYGHIGGGLYSLSNLDLHSGFAAMTKEVTLWVPTSLVIWKMLCASMLVFALLFGNERFRRQEPPLVLAGLAVVAGFLVEASIELGFSYGPNEGRVSTSLVQTVFHGGILVLLALGYGGYKLLLGRIRQP